MNKSRVLLVLTITAAIFGIGLWAGGYFKRSDATAITPPKEHVKLRAAKLSAQINTAWTQNIGGSDDDRLISAYALGDKIYIFASTDSRDYDCGADTRALLAVLDKSGTITAMVEYTLPIVAVSLSRDCFVAAIESGGVYLSSILLDGTITNTVALPDSYNENVSMLTSDESGIVLLTSRTGQTDLEILKISHFSHKLAYEWSSVTNESYSLSPRALYCISGTYIVPCLAQRAGIYAFALARFTVGTPTVVYNRIEGSNVYDVIPAPNGYYALIGDQTPQILAVDTTGKLTVTYHIEGNAGGKLFFHEGTYYVADGSEPCAVYRLTSNGLTDKILIGAHICSVSTIDNPILCAEHNNTSYLYSFDGAVKDIRYVDRVDNAVVLNTEGKVFLVGTTNRGYGAKDVIVVGLR